MTMLKHIEEFQKKGERSLNTLSEKDLESILDYCNNEYYNFTEIISDTQYDIIKEFINKKYPKNIVLTHIGSTPKNKKIKLPYTMWSMDKIKPDTNDLERFKKKHKDNYVVSTKLDGVSGLYSTENNEYKLYTRGDGIIGQDISYFLTSLNLPKVKDIVVRGEFIISKNVFNEKYKESFANPRNLSSGIINSDSSDKIKDIDFIVYELIKPVLLPCEQLQFLNHIGFNIAQNIILNYKELTNDNLSNTLIEWRKNYKYEIDGIIVCNNIITERLNCNPEHAFAFKMILQDQIAEAKVLDVIWSASRHGYLKPRIRIEPIRLSGVTIEYATGFNANFIYSNKIGIGSVVTIIRSGDVIPHIKDIVISADEPLMPQEIDYHWNDTHVDIILDNIQDNRDVKDKNITSFFTILKVDSLAIGNVKKIISAGFDTVPKILKMEKKDFGEISGFKDKMTDKIYDGIKKKVKEASLIDIVLASNKFIGGGLGSKKITLIMTNFPNIFTKRVSKIELTNINSIGVENANTFINNIEIFLEFIKECNLEYKLQKNDENETKNDENETKNDENETKNDENETKNDENEHHILYNKKIVMSKVRDIVVIQKIKDCGGLFVDNITKETFALIIKDKDETSIKTKYAKKNEIPIYEINDFVNKYLI
jgi:DNA ligase (NAD+)